MKVEKNKVNGMRVKYTGPDLVAMKTGKVYDVISIENGWYRIMTEIDEDYLFPPKVFEIIDKVTPAAEQN